MAKKKAITKVLSCFVVFVILMSAMPSSAFAMRDNNDVSGKTIGLADTEAEAASVLEIKFTGTAVERCGVIAGFNYWNVNIEEVISGPPWSGKLTVHTWDIFADSPRGYVDPDITIGDKVEVYGKCAGSSGEPYVTLYGRTDYYIKKTERTTKCGKITNWKTACTNVQLGGKFGAEMDFDNLMAGGYRFKGIVRVRSPTDEEYSGESQPRFVPSSPNNHGKFAGGNTLYAKIPEGAATGKYDVKLELWNVDTNELCDDTGWKENIFTVKDGGAVSGIVFTGTALEYYEGSIAPGNWPRWEVSVDEIISGPPELKGHTVFVSLGLAADPCGYMDPNIESGDKVKVYGRCQGDNVWLFGSEDYYIKKSSSSASIKITSVSPPPGTTLNAGDTVTFGVNVDYDLGPNDYGKIRLSVNQYTTGITDKEYSIGIFDPHSGSYTFTPHTETIGDDWENVYVTVKLYAAKQGEPLPTPYTDFDYKQYPVKGKGEGSLLHFDLDYKGTEPASGKGDGTDQHQIYAQPGQSFVMYMFYEEGNAGNQYIIRAYPEWDKNSFILNSDNDESTSELAQEMGGHRYDVETYINPSVPGEYKIKVVYSNSAAPPTWDNYNRLLGEFTVIVEGGGDCFEDVPSNHWKGEYYNNKNLDGSPSMVRNDGDADLINFDWGYDSPSTACGIGSDFFSVRWTRTLNFDSGTWSFTATTDDGMRVYVDGSLVIDKWFNQVATTYTADVDLTAGTHTIKVEYYEYDLTAVAKLSWEKDDGKEVKFTGTATDYWVSGGQIHHWTVLVDEVISGPQPCEDQVNIMVYDSELPPPWGYVDPNLNVGDRVEVYGRYYYGDCSAIHLHGSTDYYIKIGEDKKPDLAFKEIYFRDGANDITVAESGQRVSAHLTLMNKGEKDVDKAKVELYIKKEGEDTLLDSKDIYNIAADSRLGFALYFNSPSESDSYNIYAIVDRENIVDEGPYEDNNKISTELKVLTWNYFDLDVNVIYPENAEHIYYRDNEMDIPIMFELVDSQNNRKIDFIQNAKLEGYIDAMPLKKPFWEIGRPIIRLQLPFKKYGDKYHYDFDTHQYKEDYGEQYYVDPDDMTDIEDLAFVWGEYWVHVCSFSYPPNENKPEYLKSVILSKSDAGNLYFTIGQSEYFMIDQVMYPLWYAIVVNKAVKCVASLIGGGLIKNPYVYITGARIISAIQEGKPGEIATIMIELISELKSENVPGVVCAIEFYKFIIDELPKHGIEVPDWVRYWETWQLWSPGTLHVYDQDGNHVGVNSAGGIDEEIPGVGYSGPDMHPQVVFIFGQCEDMKIVVKGTESGKFDLMGKVDTPEKQQKIEYNDVPVSSNTIAEVDISSLNPDYTMKVDEDGDCNIDYIRNPDLINNLPIANFTFSPREPTVNQTITFDASTSQDPEGFIVNHSWDFGAGSYETGKIITHSYTSTGNYDVTLTVTDNDGATATTSKIITVYPQTTIQLHTGWNLISLPVMPDDTDITTVLSPISGKYSIIWTYNASDTSDYWKKYDSSAPFGNDLTTMEPGKGYWILMTSDDTLPITGTVPLSTDIDLTTGWNLIGYSSLDSQPVADALSSISGNYNIVWTYDASDTYDHWKKYDSSAPFGNDLTRMEPGKGYWILMNSDDTLKI